MYSTDCVHNSVSRAMAFIPLVLCRPTTAYAPWFGVVLKTARLAVSIISILSEEVRSCCSAYRRHAVQQHYVLQVWADLPATSACAPC